MTREEIIGACYQIPGMMWPIELGWLYDTFKNSKTHAEIGSYCGKSLIASMGSMSNAKVLSVDNYSILKNPQWGKDVFKATVKAFKPQGVEIAYYEGHSINCSREQYKNGLRFDSIFIDACHEYAECKADIEAWILLVKKGGIIAGHDYWAKDVGVMDAVNEVFEGKAIIFEGSRIWSYRL